MTDEERQTLRRKIREMMDRVPETAELTDPEERKAKMRELLTKYELVVEEEDPDWPEDAEDGMRFSLGQFFDKITVKAEKKDEEKEEEDKGYQSDKEIVWEDDNYIKPIRDVKTQDWDASEFTDFGPMIVLVHITDIRDRRRMRWRGLSLPRLSSCSGNTICLHQGVWR